MHHDRPAKPVYCADMIFQLCQCLLASSTHSLAGEHRVTGIQRKGFFQFGDVATSVLSRRCSGLLANDNGAIGMMGHDHIR